MQSKVIIKDYPTLGERDIQVEIQLYANGDILALLPNTDLAVAMLSIVFGRITSRTSGLS